MTAAAFVLVILLTTAVRAVPVIDVVYPRPVGDDTIARIDRVDYNFIFGSVTPAGARLNIDGFPAEPAENGAFLEFLPVVWERRC